MLYGFWDFNFGFFYDFFKNLPNEHKETCCFSIQQKHICYGTHNG